MILRLFLLGALLSFAACSNETTPGEETPAGVQNIRSELSRELSPSDADQDALAAGNRAFAFDLYGELRVKPGNLFCSPYSISVALAMLYAGAEGNTEAQMKSALHFDLPEADLHQAFNHVDLELASRGEMADGIEGQPFRLNVVNQAWTQKDFEIKAAYLDTLARNYGAGVFALDFASDPEGARQTINQWVADNTEALIKELFPQGTIDAMTVLALTNAVYFNAAWAVPFNEDQTQTAKFKKLDGSEVDVEMMNGGLRTNFAEGANYKAVAVPYDAHELSFIAVLPNEGEFDAVQAELGETFWAELQSALSEHQVTLAMPKFDYGSKFSLRETLQSLGMTDAFVPGVADLSGIQDPVGRLVVQAVVHQAVIRVNEQGTDAAAATGVSVGPTSAPPPGEIRLDRPFLHFIVDNPTGQILFAGRVVDPTAN